MRISIRPAHPFDAPAIVELLSPAYGVQTNELEVQLASPDTSSFWVGVGEGSIVAAAKASALGAGNVRMVQLDWLAVKRHAGDTITARKLLDAAVGDMPALAVVDQTDTAIQNVLKVAGFEHYLDTNSLAPNNSNNSNNPRNVTPTLRGTHIGAYQESAPGALLRTPTKDSPYPSAQYHPATHSNATHSEHTGGLIEMIR